MTEKTEVQKLETKLLSLCKQEDSFVVTINGEWGVGKTHFWDDFVQEHLKEQTVAYVSLFGKESIKEILTSIMVQISTHAKRAEEADDVFRTSKLFGIDLAAVFSIGKPRDFSDVIVCFDDFERSSEKIDDKDILGLISELKEQKNCKVIMIYNQSEVTSKVFSKYKDKIVDYELYFKPTVLESYSHISNKLKTETPYPLAYFEGKGINNIRLMKRAVNALNDFDFIKTSVNGFDDIKYEIMYIILQISICNAKYNTYNLLELVEYTEKKREQEGESDFKINDDYEDMLYLLDIEDSRYFMPNDITKNIDFYIQGSIPDEQQLLKIIAQRKQQSNRYQVTKAVHTIQSKFNYDLNYVFSNYANDMFAVFKENSDYIVDILTPNNFIFYIEELDTVNSEEEYHSFGVECLKQYLTNYLKDERVSSLNTFGGLKKIKDFDDCLEVHIDEIESSKLITQVAAKESVLELMTKPRENGYFGDESETLMLVTDESYSQYIKEDPAFFEGVIDFIKWSQGFGGHSSFEDVKRRLTEILRKIGDEGDDSVKYKISRALKYLNLEAQIPEEA